MALIARQNSEALMAQQRVLFNSVACVSTRSSMLPSSSRTALPEYSEPSKKGACVRRWRCGMCVWQGDLFLQQQQQLERALRGGHNKRRSGARANFSAF